jgi:hypothetical protein
MHRGGRFTPAPKLCVREAAADILDSRPVIYFFAMSEPFRDADGIVALLHISIKNEERLAYV